ncbi:MAG: hypothetical protein ACTHU0_35810 [Kofleriaceae bacterium]
MERDGFDPVGRCGERAARLAARGVYDPDRAVVRHDRDARPGRIERRRARASVANHRLQTASDPLSELEAVLRRKRQLPAVGRQRHAENLAPDLAGLPPGERLAIPEMDRPVLARGDDRPCARCHDEPARARALDRLAAAHLAGREVEAMRRAGTPRVRDGLSGNQVRAREHDPRHRLERPHARVPPAAGRRDERRPRHRMLREERAHGRADLRRGRLRFGEGERHRQPAALHARRVLLEEAPPRRGRRARDLVEDLAPLVLRVVLERIAWQPYDQPLGQKLQHRPPC